MPHIFSFRVPSFSDCVFFVITVGVAYFVINRFAPEQMMTYLPGVLAGVSLRFFGIRLLSWSFFALLPLFVALYAIVVQVSFHYYPLVLGQLQ